MRCAAVLDGTLGTAAKQARALHAVLHGGLAGGLTEHVPAETFVFYSEDRDRDRLVELSPTRDVRLIKTPARRPDRVADVLAEVARRERTSLFVWDGGGAAAEAAARLACRTGGSLLTDVLSAEVLSGASPDAGAGAISGASTGSGSDGAHSRPRRLACRKNLYSAHMVGRFELSALPWCVTLDAGWADAPTPALLEHRIVSDTDETAGAGVSPFGDLYLSDPPAVGDIAESRFLVVAGRGAGGRGGVERIAEAARRMGAAFGVSRAVAMNAWAPVKHLVGVSGARAAPDVCIVVGASGAPALHWGIEKAKYIVAVNLDEHAPIVRNADVALVDDGVAVIEGLAQIIAECGDLSASEGTDQPLEG